MADFHGSARSNYFRVKDKNKFLEWVAGRKLEMWEDEPAKKLGILRFAVAPPRDSDNGMFPEWDYDETADEWSEVDFAGEIAEHLAEGSVAILMMVGSEKLRYLRGSALAIRSDGAVLRMDLDKIHDLARKEWNVSAEEMTSCTY